MSTKGDAEEAQVYWTNSRVTIRREDGATRLWIHRTGVGPTGYPNAIWGRMLTDQECAALLDNPFLMYSAPAKTKG